MLYECHMLLVRKINILGGRGPRHCPSFEMVKLKLSFRWIEKKHLDER